MMRRLVLIAGFVLAVFLVGCGPKGVAWDCTCTGDCDGNNIDDWETEVCSDGTEDDAPGQAIDECRADLGCSSWDIHCDCSAMYQECLL